MSYTFTLLRKHHCHLSLELSITLNQNCTLKTPASSHSQPPQLAPPLSVSRNFFLQLPHMNGPRHTISPSFLGGRGRDCVRVPTLHMLSKHSNLFISETLRQVPPLGIRPGIQTRSFRVHRPPVQTPTLALWLKPQLFTGLVRLGSLLTAGNSSHCFEVHKSDEDDDEDMMMVMT